MIYKGEGVDVPSGRAGSIRRLTWAGRSSPRSVLIFYTDGPPDWALVTSDDWDDGRDEDVQGVILFEGNGYSTKATGYDEYTIPGSTRVKRGRIVPDTVWDEYAVIIRGRQHG